MKPKKTKANERFEPEADGRGKVRCPADHKAIKALAKKPNNQSMREALIAALSR